MGGVCVPVISIVAPLAVGIFFLSALALLLRHLQVSPAPPSLLSTLLQSPAAYLLLVRCFVQ